MGHFEWLFPYHSINTAFDVTVIGVDTGLEFSLPIIAKYGDHKTYCPNQDTFKSAGSAFNNGPGQKAQTVILEANWESHKQTKSLSHLIRPSVYKNLKVTLHTN